MPYTYPEVWTEELIKHLPDEDNRYEWKLGLVESLSDENSLRKKLSKELGAFANSFGGTLFLGLSDTREFIGVKKSFKGRELFKEWLENIIPSLFELRLNAFRVTHVELLPETQENIGSEKAILAIDVLDSDLAPHQSSDLKYYYRVSSHSDPAPHHYLAFLWGRTNPNMANVVSWWFKEFLDPVIQMLDNANAPIQSRRFQLATKAVQDQIFIWVYKINFFELVKLRELVASSVGEYFLTTFPAIKNALANLETEIKTFEDAFEKLTIAIRNSVDLKARLVNRYEKMIASENVQGIQFGDLNFEQISQRIFGQMQVPITQYPEESGNRMAFFSAYSLLQLTCEFQGTPDMRDNASWSFCSEISQDLNSDDSVVARELKAAKKILPPWLKHLSQCCLN